MHLLNAIRLIPLDKTLKALFVLALGARFIYPFYFSPLDHLFSDPARHWYNGVRFFSGPLFMNGVDAKFYQLLLWGVSKLSLMRPGVIALYAGLLCAVMPLVWYKAARELMPRRPALIASLIIAVHPSLLLIYCYFMTETVALVLLGLGVWLTLRTRRKGTLWSFTLAALVWVLAIHTRTALLPAAVLSTMFMFAFISRRKLALCITALLLYATTLPAMIYSYNAIHVFSPFMFSAPNKVYFYAGTRGYQLHIYDEGNYGWTSPSMDSRPLQPFSDYATYRENSTPRMYGFGFSKVDGYTPWEGELAKLKERYSLRQRAQDIMDNFVFYTFGHSWPDSSLTYTERPIWKWNHVLRWTWPPLILAVLCLFPWMRLRQEAAYVVGLAFAITLLMYVQQSGIMEGRYRKLFEPLLILAVPLLWQAWKRPAGERPWRHVLEIVPLVLGLRVRNRAAGRAPRGIHVPDTRPVSPGTRTAPPPAGTAAKPRTPAPKKKPAPRKRPGTPKRPKT